MRTNMLVEIFPIKIDRELDAKIGNEDIKIPLSALGDVDLAKIVENARVEIYRLAGRPLPLIPSNKSFVIESLTQEK